MTSVKIAKIKNVCKSGDLDLVKSCMADKTYVYDYSTAMYCAGLGGHLNIVEFMISIGADNFIEGLSGACLGGHLFIVKFLIEKLNEDAILSLNCVFHHACYSGNLELVKYMIANGVNAWESGFNRACHGGHMPIVQLMISKLTEIDEFNRDDLRGLDYACIGGNIDIVKLMIDLTFQDTKTSKTSTKWFSALYNACENGHMSVVQLIISASGGLEGSNIYTWSHALQWACQSGNMDLVRLIISKIEGSDESSKIYTPIWNMGFIKACNFNNTPIVQLMISKGANDWHNGLGNACYNGHISIVKLILESQPSGPRGPEISVNWNYQFEWACSGGCIEIVQLMISKGADSWNNGLENACKNGHIDIVKLVLSYGANKLDTALFNAYLNGHMNIVHLLISNSAKTGVKSVNLGNIKDAKWPSREVIKLIDLGTCLDAFVQIKGYQDLVGLASKARNLVLKANVLIPDLLMIVAKCIII